MRPGGGQRRRKDQIDLCESLQPEGVTFPASDDARTDGVGDRPVQNIQRGG